jgi:uncharacterized protein
MDPVNSAVLSQNLELVKSLIKTNENIEIKDRGGRTPFLNAVIEDNLPIVKLLEDQGANIAVQDNMGYSALHFASQNQSIEMTRYLIEKGSAIDVVDAHGNTPLGRAVYTSRGKGEVIKMLLAAGAKKMKKNFHGISPWDLANSIENYDVKRFLIDGN